MSLRAVQIQEQATELLNQLPTPRISKATARVYRATMLRMLNEDVVDPLRPGDARDTYNLRRAALHAGTWYILRRELTSLDRAAQAANSEEAERALAVLARIVERCGPAIKSDPPADRSKSTFLSERSRWAASDIPHPKRGKGSKKHLLRYLPSDWMAVVWDAARENWAYRDALAVHMLTPVRPAEFVPGERDGRWVAGVVVALRGDILVIGVAPVKSHDGKYGTGETGIRLRADSSNPAVQHLAQRCRTARGGAIMVTLDGTNGMRKALEKLGRRALGDGVTITGYVYRHQAIADFKKTFGAGLLVAAAAGHCTERTQSAYGRVEHGRRRTELISVTAKRAPRVGNIERARALSDGRKAAMNP